MDANFPWILESDCYLVKYWEMYMLFLVGYVCLVYPYLIGFERSFSEGFVTYAEIVIELSLGINLMISILTSIRTKKKYIKTFKLILNYRLNTLGFYLDMIAIIPFEFIIIVNEIIGYQNFHKIHLYYLCKGVKLCLIWRLSSFFEKMEKSLLFNTMVIKVRYYFESLTFVV